MRKGFGSNPAYPGIVEGPGQQRCDRLRSISLAMMSFHHRIADLRGTIFARQPFESTVADQQIPHSLPAP